jgi:peptidylprolyl isomerase
MKNQQRGGSSPALLTTTITTFALLGFAASSGCIRQAAEQARAVPTPVATATPSPAAEAAAHGPDDGHGHGADDGHGHGAPAGPPAASPKMAALPASPGKMTKTPSGLQYEDVTVGKGPAAKAGQPVAVHYTGTLTNGTKFDSSRDRGEPFTFTLGAGAVIRGWDEGVAGMQVGGRRKLVIPPDLGYGERGAGADIPPNSTLVFDVELMGISATPPTGGGM